MEHRSRRDFLRWSGAGTFLALSGGASLRAGAAAPLGTLKVGVALVSPAAELGWTKQHTLGAEAIKAALGAKVEINFIDNVAQPQDAERVFRQFASSGPPTRLRHELFAYRADCTARRRNFRVWPSIVSSGVKTLANLGGFEARYHEGAYIAGIAAARTTKTGKLGFIGGYPVPDIVGPANAFLLGAQSVKPTITLLHHFHEFLGGSRQGEGRDTGARRARLRCPVGHER